MQLMQTVCILHVADEAGAASDRTAPGRQDIANRLSSCSVSEGMLMAEMQKSEGERERESNRQALSVH
jgi:hypothetical protein